jgi:fructokinase
VDTIDATGAGNGFVAGLLNQLVQNMKLLSDEMALRSALQFACACDAITATGCGAIPSLPDSCAESGMEQD